MSNKIKTKHVGFSETVFGFLILIFMDLLNINFKPDLQ